MKTYSPQIASWSKNGSLRSQTTISAHLALVSVASFLLLVALLFIAPTQDYTHATQTDMTVDVPTVVSLSATTPTPIDISDSTAFYTTSTTVTANTNSEGGYTLTMASNDPNSTDLINQDTTTTIPSIDSAITVDATGSNFTTNHWAYHSPLHTTNNYNPIPANNSAETIASADQAVSGDTSTVTFGVKASSSLPAGEYKNTVVFSIIAKEKPKDLSKATYLQDLATHPEYCTNTQTGVTALLKDSRDDKQYRVRKLKDGKCWMIDNLRLGTAGQALTLTTADSNVNSTKTIPAAQIVNSGTTKWDNGSSTTQAQYQTYHIYNREDATFTETTDTQGTYYDVSGNDYGNLYNWWTATAGSGIYNTSKDTEVSESICPKGWVLPKNATGAGSFYTLYQSYNSQSLMTTVAAKDSTVADRGPEFKLAGYYNGGAKYAGSEGNYWSRTAYGYDGSSYRAYYLSLDTSDVVPQGYYYQYRGYSVRCIAS